MKKFLWGVATSSYQIEGASDQRGRNIWDAFCEQEGKILDGSSGKFASDHVNKYREDVQLMSQLGINSYRFSVSWPRIFPNGTGNVNQKGLDFYKNLIDSLLEKNIDPFVTLYHWDLPEKIQELGGWPVRDNVERFLEYVNFIVGELRDKVKYFCIINEPSVVAYNGFLLGEHAPGIRDRNLFLKAIHHLNLAHSKSVPLVKSIDNDLLCGSCYTYFPFYPTSENKLDVKAAEILDVLWTRAHIEPAVIGQYPSMFREWLAPLVSDIDEIDLKCDADFIGINHYCVGFAQNAANEFHAEFAAAPAEAGSLTAMGWPVNAQEFEKTLIDFRSRYGNIPLIVSENGAAYDDTIEENGEINDVNRINYFDSYISSMKRAIDSGVNVLGYFAWSFLDNFEWSFGNQKRFGLVYVDYKNNFQRNPKKSYWNYKKIISNGF